METIAGVHLRTAATSFSDGWWPADPDRCYQRSSRFGLRPKGWIDGPLHPQRLGYSRLRRCRDVDEVDNLQRIQGRTESISIDIDIRRSLEVGLRKVSGAVLINLVDDQ